MSILLLKSGWSDGTAAGQSAVDVTLELTALGLSGSSKARDVWGQKDVSIYLPLPSFLPRLLSASPFGLLSLSAALMSDYPLESVKA